MEGSATRNADHREGLTVHHTVHTAPVGDLVSHDIDIGLTMTMRFSPYDVCACGPVITIYPSGGIEVSHNSLDGREHREPKRRLFRRRRNSSPGWIIRHVHHP